MPQQDTPSSGDIGSPPPGSDGSLLRRFRSGEQDAATELYRRYALKLDRLAVRNTGDDLGARFDSDDVVQSVFRTFFRRVQDGLYDLPEGEELWRLLLVIALNKIRKLATHHRAQKRSVSSTQSPGVSALERMHAGEDGGVAFASLKGVVEDLLVDMPAQQQRVVLLRIEGWQVDEIAAETGRSRRTVERVLQAFRKRLRELIDEPHFGG